MKASSLLTQSNKWHVPPLCVSLCSVLCRPQAGRTLWTSEEGVLVMTPSSSSIGCPVSFSNKPSRRAPATADALIVEDAQLVLRVELIVHTPRSRLAGTLPPQQMLKRLQSAFTPLRPARRMVYARADDDSTAHRSAGISSRRREPRGRRQLALFSGWRTYTSAETR